MGCTIAKNVSPKSAPSTARLKVQKSELSLQHDPRLPLSARELFSVTKSWKAVGREMALTGTNMFIRLFETNEDIKKVFGQKFGEVDHTVDVLQNTALANHATVVLCTIDDAIVNLDDVDYVIEMLENVGRTHRLIKGFNKDFFLKIEDPFLLAIKETLGDRYNTNSDKTYRRVIRFILEQLQHGFLPPEAKTESVNS